MFIRFVKVLPLIAVKRSENRFVNGAFIIDNLIDKIFDIDEAGHLFLWCALYDSSRVVSPKLYNID